MLENKFLYQTTLDTSINVPTDLQRTQEARNEYGDWQTSFEFACLVCRYLKRQGIDPQIIIEPTCGKGNFIKAAIATFDNLEEIYGVEIYKPYLDELKVYTDTLNHVTVHLFYHDVFTFNFNEIKCQIQGKNMLILGNPPWVTNSELSKNNSENIPTKYNYRDARGIEAITGKGNFDIAESICNLLIESFTQREGDTNMALLVKNSVIKNIIEHQHPLGYRISSINQLSFDAKKEFGVSVSASLFSCKVGDGKDVYCSCYDIYTEKQLHSYGWIKDSFVSDIEHYNETSQIDGKSQLVWRSGIKHDCSKVMELTPKEDGLYNGLGETVIIEDNSIYPFIKSSDIGNGFSGEVRKYLVLPHLNLTEPSAAMKQRLPIAYAYLERHGDFLDGRKSSIYKKKPRFAVFGLGDYSFKPYKVVISALYKSLKFSLLTPINNKVIMLDDTCYMLGFDNFAYAKITCSILNSQFVQQFISTISFADAKRIVSSELLMRIDLLKALELLQKTMTFDGVSESDIQQYISYLKSKNHVDSPSLLGGLNIDVTENSFWGQPCKLQQKQKNRCETTKYKQLNLQNLFAQYEDSPIVKNNPIRAVACRVSQPSMPVITAKVKTPIVANLDDLDLSKNLLVSLVKNDNIERYLDGSANIYYTGKRFPSTVHLNHLYYFMPYIKGKGVRDLYLIKVARVGTRREGYPDNDPNDFRLVFEVEFVKQLFDDYKPIELEIWHTYTDTTLGGILNIE